MLHFLLNIIKIAFLLGFLVFIHEAGHFLVAKLFKVKVNEFAIGFGPVIWEKQGKETKYQLRIIPLGGFVNLLGEENQIKEKNSYSEASKLKKILILIAGGTVNILFGLIVFFILVYVNVKSFPMAIENTLRFGVSIIDGLKELFTGSIGVEQFTGPIGISEVVVKTENISQFVYILSLVSLSLGVTNLLPFPPLDGGKALLIIIEAIIRKPIKENINNAIQMIGFCLIMGLALIVTYNDILRVF